MARLAKETATNDVRVIAVHMPLEHFPGITKEEYPVVVGKAVSKYDGSFDTVWDTREQNLFVKLGIESLPVTLGRGQRGGRAISGGRLRS